MGSCRRRTQAWAALLLLTAFAPIVLHCHAEEDGEQAAEIGVMDSQEGAHGEAMSVRLQPTVKRKRAEVMAVVDRLKKLPGMEGVVFTVATRDLIVLSLSSQHVPMQLKDLLLAGEAEVYEVEIGEDTYRREGDEPHGQVRRTLVTKARTRFRDRLADKLKGLLRLKRKAPDAAASGGAGALDEGAGEEEAAASGGSRGGGKHASSKKIKRNDGKRRRRRQQKIGGGGKQGNQAAEL